MGIKKNATHEFLSGGGEAGEIIRHKDWSQTSLGDPEKWPQSLKTCVRIILTSSQPMFVWWGTDLVNIYNDAYKTIVGGKHPWAFGRPASEVWKEIWNEVSPRVETVMTQNIGTYDEALLLILERNGYPEETYYTFSYSPIPGDKGRVGGIICANIDHTDSLINERSIQTLRDLAALSNSEKDVEYVYRNAAEVLLKNNKDFPFAVFYKIAEEDKTATAVAWSGDKEGYKDFPLTASLAIPMDGTRNLARAVETNTITHVKNDGRRHNIPKGAWDIIPQEFVHIPISQPNKGKPLAVLTIGLNPYRQFNHVYKNFIKLVADQISLLVNNVLAYEEERKRVETHIKMAHTRLHNNNQLYNLFIQAPLAILVLRGKEMNIEMANEKMLELLGKNKDIIGNPLMKGLPEIKGQGFDLLLDNVFTSGTRFVSKESPASLIRGGSLENIYVKFVFEALFDENGQISGVMAVGDEITEQVAARKIVEVSEKRYEQLIETLPVAIYTCDAEGYITLYNQAAVNIWGREPEMNKEKWCGAWRTFKTDGVTPIPPDGGPMAQVLKERSLSNREMIIETPNGQRSYVRPNPTPVYNENGKLSGAVNMLTDLTEQKKAQKKIDENQLLFNTISNSAPVGLWITNSGGKCTFVNETWTSWTGVSLDDTITNGWFGQVVEADKAEALKNFTTAIQQKVYFSGEFRLMRADGQLRWCFTEGYPFDNAEGEFMGYAGSVTDITERKTAQDELEKLVEERTKNLRLKNKELKSSEEKYHRMTEEVQDYAIILLDKEGAIMNWNNGAKKIKGYTEEEIIGKNFRIFYLPEDRESYLPEKLISQAVETGRAADEGWRIRKDGTTFWANIVITALHDEKSNVIGFSKVTRDLTERKIAEDTARKYLTELEKQNAELEQFAYVSSHDLQEPLRKIRTFSDLLLSQTPDGEQKNYLIKINSSAERMSSLIRDLLDYSRITRVADEFVPVDLNVILENVKTDLEVLIAQKNAIVLNDHLPIVKGIPLQLNQLFLNLLSNSLKFNTGEPIVKINIKSAPLYETIAAKLDPKWPYLKLTFSDNGIGFEPQYADQIFTIFQRLNTRQKFSGTGIGLAMCKKILDNHNGHIFAQSIPAEGATFNIYLPVR